MAKVIRLTENDVERLVKRILKEDLSRMAKLGMAGAAAVIGVGSMIIANGESHDVKVIDQNGVEREAETGEVFNGIITKIEDASTLGVDNDVKYNVVRLTIKTKGGETVRVKVDTPTDMGMSIYDPKEFEDYNNQKFKVGDTITLKVEPKTYFFDRSNLKK